MFYPPFLIYKNNIMKTSFYNNSTEYENNVILHNGLSGKFLILNPYLYNLFEISSKENRINELIEIHGDFYNSLIKGGFLVDDSFDEVRYCYEKMKEVDNENDTFHLIINPTLNCNFKCWYCYETHVKDSRINEGVKNNITKYISRLIKDKERGFNNFILSWFGGEPLLQFVNVMVPILEESYKICHDNGIKFYSNITTNALLVNNRVVEIAKKYNLTPFQITLDGHKDRHNKVRYISKNKGSYDEIIKNIKLLLNNEINVLARINCSEDTFTDLEKILEDFNNIDSNSIKYLSFSFHKVWQTEKNVEEDMSKYIKIFRQNGFTVVNNYLNINISCYADKLNQATINYDGNVFKCTARDFTEENREGILTDEGEIIWNEKYPKRFESKHKNRPCLECSILPVCKGGCSQYSMEKEEEYCIYDFDEIKKKKIILDLFLTQIQNISAL